MPGKKTRPIFWFLLVAAILLVSVPVYLRLGDEFPEESTDLNTARHRTVAIFGATGTAGDGLLKAAMSDPHVEKIHVVTRRSSPRIDEGVASGKVQMTTHLDYRNYAPIRGLLVQVEAVYWGLGTSARNVSTQDYGIIHVDFPIRLAREWLSVHGDTDLSFHLVSGMGAGEDSRMHWAREKARAEQELFKLADTTRLRVISYRPSLIVPTEEQANLLNNLAHAILQPVKLAIRATRIGEAMLEVSARGEQLPNRTILENREILMYANGYATRVAPAD